MSDTAKKLMALVDERKYVDVGKGVETVFGLSPFKMSRVVKEMADQGYKIFYILLEQKGTGKKYVTKVLTKDDVTYTELYQNRDKITGVE